jgi:cell wall-associated NlpC family hydrolase
MDRDHGEISVILLSCQTPSECGSTTVVHARRRIRRSVALFLGLVLVLSACSHSPEVIQDLRSLPQNARFYLDQAHADRQMLSAEDQALMDENFDQVYFAPWHRTRPRYCAEDLVRRLERYRGDPGFGENQRPHTREWIDRLDHSAHLDTYPNAGFPAITLGPTDLRELPTHRPHFHRFDQAGEGYPFDNLQYSSIAPNTPVFISHISRDGSWLLAESHYGLGWLAAREVAKVDAAFINAWEAGPFVTIVRDDVPIAAENGTFLFKASLGLPLPKAGEDAAGYGVWVAVTDQNRRALLLRARIAENHAVAKPLRFTAGNVARLANEMLGQAYGWGGSYGNRDCSATLKDLFAPFGLMLPRNSAHQATATGSFIALSDLSPAEKASTILQRGVPCFTLLWQKGHIMLYLGNHRGQPVVFHNFWGIKTRNLLGREGRKVVGQAVITTLHPGAELPDLDRPQGDFLHRLEGMTLLVPWNRDP